ncbi:glycyl-tRNA synthetase beta chain [Persephonella hydrogeniphila]|uniref:Glycine--tRNA ligase beta subunit n=1 Tax=Persephonella hydrogeniphila TaxID=198703 RepID=A0A285N3Q9_9AQUI|nr:glycine--tRNA ligase subunit beta [Persephonella hydrogeniphila]SNZ04092.1 glycyl-tRNA synthetase beta chain [Persephonella hydrogeniphila]
MKNYLLEIGTEELPPKAVDTAIRFFEENIYKIFNDFFEYDTPENIEIFGTPRRIGFLLKNLKEKQPDSEKLLIGPPAKVGIDNEGKYTKAALSFASKNNIPVEELQIIENEKGRYIGAKILIEGRKLSQHIKEEIPEIIQKIPFPKTMRWNSTGFRFSRPIRWIVSLLDEEVIPFEIAGVKAGRYTHLHRFMTSPVGRGEKKEIQKATDYKEITKMGFVLSVYEEREKSIRTQIEGFGRVLEADPVIDEELLREVTNLTEFPVGILGDFSPEYLVLPKEVIITVCKVHQRYFNFEKNGELIPKFLAFSNTSVPDKNVIKNGYEKVLKARLEDALFFYEEDLKHNLEDFYPKLAGIQFHQKLGSMLEKVERNGEIAFLLAEELGIDKKKEIERANKLSKCDLLTEMVKEFDELQGIMGMHYALKQGEKEEIAKAIYEHYLPRSSDDELPETETGTILSLSDKIDTVISFFSIGEKPKPAADPFGLRRNAIGIVRLLVEKEIDIDLLDLLHEISERAKISKILKFAQLNKEWKVVFDEKIIPEVIEFIKGRFVAYLKDKGFDTDIINAVLSTEDNNLYRLYLKVKSIQKLKENPEFEDVMIVFKRVGKIIPEGFEEQFSENELIEKEEKELYQKFKEVQELFEKDIKQKEYYKALEELLRLKPFIDRFFDNVMVMVEDQKLRKNRLSLMKIINKMFLKIADFTKITTA